MRFYMRMRFQCLMAVLAAVKVAQIGRAQFIPTAAGIYKFDDAATNADNWTNGTPTGNFPQNQSGPQTITFGADTTLATGLTFNLGGTNPALTLRSDGSGDRTLTLGADIAASGSNSASITIGSATSGQGLTLDLAAATRTFSVAAGNTLTVVNKIAGTESALRKGGNGLLVLAGQSCYDGTTYVDAGTLKTTVANALPTTTTVSMAPGATLALEADQTLRDLTGTGTVSIAAWKLLEFDTPLNLQFDGTLTGSGAIDLCADDGGSLNLTGANTYSGGTTIEMGVLTALNATGSATGTGAITVDSGAKLQIGGGSESTVGSVSGDISVEGTGNVTFARSDSRTYGGAVSGAGTLTVEGPGTLTLTGANTLSGDTQVKANATLVAGALNTLSSASSVYVYGDGTLDVSFSQTIAGLESGLSGATASVDLDANTVLTVNVPNLGNETFEGVISGAGSVTKSGSGQQVFSGLNTYTGKTTISGGVLTVTRLQLVSIGDGFGASGLGAAADTADTLVLDGGRLQYSGGSAASTDRLFTLGAGGGTIDTSGGGAITFSNHGSIAFATANTSATLQLDSGSAVTNTFNPVITDSATGVTSLRKNGVGTWVLGGANTFTGTTDIAYGTLADGTNAASFSTASAITVSVNGTLAVNHDETIAGLAGAGGTTLASGVTLKVANDNLHTYSYSGVISGSGGFAKDGIGSLILTGNNTYSGGTTILQGTLNVGVGGTSGWVAGDIVNDGSLVFNRSDDVTFDHVISGSGGLYQFGSGHLSITGVNVHTGGTVVNAGYLVLKDGGALPGNVTFTGNTGVGGGELQFGQSTAATFSGNITGPGRLSQVGTGTTTLTGTNSYTGSTTVSGGTLKAGATGALPSTTGLSLSAGAALNVAASQTINRFLSTDATSMIVLEAGQLLTVALGSNPGAGTQFNGTISGAGALKISDAGGFVVALTGNDSYTGGTTIDANAGLQLGLNTTTGMIAGNILNNGILSFARTNNVSFGGVISGGGMVKQVGSGNLQFTAANTYSGATQVYAGRLLAMNSSGSATGTGSIAVYSGGLFGGNGTVTGPLTVNSGGTVAPGTDLGTPATLHTGATTFGPGAVFAFQIRDATGNAGSDYSLLSSSGTLTISATSGNPFTIAVYSVDGTAPAATSHFDATQGYSWTFATAGSVVGFDAAAFQVSTTNFQNAFAGSFGVSQAGNSLLLNYTPAAVPEPATWALLGLGLGGVWWWRCRSVAAGRGR